MDDNRIEKCNMLQKSFVILKNKATPHTPLLRVSMGGVYKTALIRFILRF